MSTDLIQSPSPRGGVSLRLLVALTVVAPLVLVATALAVLAIVTSRSIAETLGAELVQTGTAQVTEEIRRYFGSAVQTSDLYARRIRDGVLPAAGLRAWERFMLDDLATREEIASICFGSDAGQSAWLLRNRGRLELGRGDGAGDGQTVEHVIRLDGSIEPEPIRVYAYDPRQRPWYAAALRSGAPVWTDVYFWFGDGGEAATTGAGYTRPIRDAEGRLLGVLVIDVTLDALSRFLATLPFSRKGQVFILDHGDRLVAASHSDVVGRDGQRLRLDQLDLPSASAAAEAMARHSTTRPASTVAALRVAGERARLSVAPVNAYPGMQWRVVTVIPDSAFMGEARATQRRALLVAGAAVVAGLLLGLSFARQLTRPLMGLVGHVRRIGAGDFASRLTLRSARELNDLADETNRMAGQLRQRLELEQSLTVARHVQQSLLPDRSAVCPGLDLAGASRYCDSTGGDYYDFLDATRLSGRRVLLAIGDVTGHGIGAALLMATARAALRAAAVDGVLPPVLLRHVNRVLTDDTRHGLFMTLVLMVLDLDAGVACWSSAGHDPAIVYDAAADAFAEFEGADIPLGIDADCPFEQFTAPLPPPGSVLVLGTDGIWESFDGAGAMYGKDRLREVIRRHAREDARAIAHAIEADLAGFRGGGQALDDVTFVVVKVLDGADASI